jgi:hypothetical protein
MKVDGFCHSESQLESLIDDSMRAMSDAMSVTARYTGVNRSAWNGDTVGTVVPDISFPTHETGYICPTQVDGKSRLTNSLITQA